MNKAKLVRAKIAIVKIGNIEIEGLEFPDGTFGIGVPQIQELFNDFLDNPNYASQRLKRLMGKDFKTHMKASTEFNKNATNTVTLQEFERIVAKLDRAGSVKAQDFRDELIGLSLQQLWADAFNRKFEKEERQQWLSSRQQSKATRRSFTTVINNYVLAHNEELSDNYKTFIYNNCTDAIYRLLFGCSAKKLRESWNCRDVRDELTIEEVFMVASIERLAATLIEEKDVEPQQAIKEAGRLMMVKKMR